MQQLGARGDQVVARARVLELAAHAREAAIGVRAQDLREEALLGPKYQAIDPRLTPARGKIRSKVVPATPRSRTLSRAAAMSR